MNLKVWTYGDEPILSLDHMSFDSEKELIKKLSVQKYPDEEFSVKIEDVCGRVKNFYFDGIDGLLLIGILLYRGMSDFVFGLDNGLQFVKD